MYVTNVRLKSVITYLSEHKIFKLLLTFKVPVILLVSKFLSCCVETLFKRVCESLIVEIGRECRLDGELFS